MDNYLTLKIYRLSIFIDPPTPLDPKEMRHG